MAGYHSPSAPPAAEASGASHPESRFNILIAFDGSAHAQAALDLVHDLFQPCITGQTCRLTTMTVLPTQYFGAHETMQQALDAARQRLKSAGMPVEVVLKSGSPAASLIAYAEENHTKLIVMGAQGLRATFGILLGGVAQQVVEYAHLPVLVVRGPYTSLRRVMVVLDGSWHSQRVIDYLAPLCLELQHSDVSAAPRIHGAQPDNAANPASRTRCSWLPVDVEVTVMHVLPPPMPPAVAARDWTLGPEVLYPTPLPPEDLEALQRNEEENGRRLLAAAREALEAAGLRVQHQLAMGDAATEIIQFARDHQIDLIACGSRGLNQVGGWLLGSVSRKLVHYGPSSALIVK